MNRYIVAKGNSDKFKIPIEMLNDIVKTCLLAIESEYKDCHGKTIPDIISHPDVEYYAECKDLFEIRKIIISVMKESKIEKMVRFANALEEIHKE